MMLLGKGFLMMDGLLRGVVMVLMDLAVDGCRCLLMLRAVDSLLLDGWCNLLVDRRVVMAILRADEWRQCCFVNHWRGRRT